MTLDSCFRRNDHFRDMVSYVDTPQGIVIESDYYLYSNHENQILSEQTTRKYCRQA
jgi:hypothetical protein